MARQLIKYVPRSDGVKSRQIRFKEGDLIVYKKPRDMDKEAFSKFLNEAAQDILARFGIDTIVVGVSHWNEVRLLTPDQLDDLGLVRREDVFLLRSDLEKMGHTGEDILALLQALEEEE